MFRPLLFLALLPLSACKTDCERFNAALADCSAAAGASATGALACASVDDENDSAIDCAANALENSVKAGACSTRDSAASAMRSAPAACGLSADTGTYDTSGYDTGTYR